MTKKQKKVKIFIKGVINIDVKMNLFKNNCKNNIYTKDFSPEAISQAKMAVNMRIATHIRARLDLRGKTAFTFGNVLSSKISLGNVNCGQNHIENMDCAFSLDKKRGIFHLGLHIADVDEYVCEGSPLDIEAKIRGKTINTPKNVYPMLHDDISKDVCSLKEGHDRLAVSVFLEIDSKGKLLRIRFEESVVNIARNCIYNEIDALYTNADTSSILSLREKYATLLPNMNDMYELGGILCAARMTAGNPSFTKINKRYSFDTNGKAATTELSPEYDSELLMQEFIAFVGSSIAQYMYKLSIPCVYANQPLPNEKDVRIMANIGNLEHTEAAHDVRLEKAIINALKTTSNADAVSAYALKALPSERYSITSQIHWLFGKTLVRFSSPSNRYSDIAVQRVIKALIKAKGETGSMNIAKIKKDMAEAATIASKAEKNVKEYKDLINDERALEIIMNMPNISYSAYIMEVNEYEVKVFLKNGITGKVIVQDCVNDAGLQNNIFDKKHLQIGEQVEVVPTDISDFSDEVIFTFQNVPRETF